MTELTIHTENPVPTTPFSQPWLSNLRRGMGREGGTPTLMAGFSLTTQDLKKIQQTILNYRRQITAALSERPAIAAELAKLVSAFPMQGQSDSPVSLRVEAYFEALGMAPAWAVREARLRVVRGQEPTLNKSFAPTPPELAEIVRAILRPHRNDLADLETLAQIEPTFDPSPEERARVGERVEELRGELRETIDKAESERATRVREHVEKANQTMFERECVAAGMDPKSQVSSALLRLLGIPTTAEVKGDVQTPVTLDRETMADIPDALERPIGHFEKLRSA